MWTWVFAAILISFWLVTVLTVFCPVRAYRRRMEKLEEESSLDPGQG